MILANVLLQDPENMIWYTGHSLKLCCVVTIMQLETDTNILVRSKSMHMPMYILGHVCGLKLILFSGMGGSKCGARKYSIASIYTFICHCYL